MSTNSEHPWLVKDAAGSEVACFCVSGNGDIALSEMLKQGPEVEAKAGYLAGGGDFAAGVTREEADRICLLNPGNTMGYCFSNSNPDSCCSPLVLKPFNEREETSPRAVMELWSEDTRMI